MSISFTAVPCDVSTHSRLKAAGRSWQASQAAWSVSTHSRLKAAGVKFYGEELDLLVSTHSRLKAAGLAPNRR